MSFDADGRLRIRCQAHEVMDPAYQIGTVQRHGSSIMQVIPVERFQKLVESMPFRVAAVIKAIGGPICY
ncbi:hypothetical protein TNCV_433401 [Trichonephila clavipes]|nr:hypothetical protein TNCV_433401 [Trichonephila clavipes]